MDYSGEAWRDTPPAEEDEEDGEGEEEREGGQRSFKLSLFTSEYEVLGLSWIFKV